MLWISADVASESGNQPDENHTPIRLVALVSKAFHIVGSDFVAQGFTSGKAMRSAAADLAHGGFSTWIATAVTVLMTSLLVFGWPAFAAAKHTIKTQGAQGQQNATTSTTTTNATTDTSTTTPTTTMATTISTPTDPATTTQTPTDAGEQKPTYATLCYATFGQSGSGAPGIIGLRIQGLFEGTKTLHMDGAGAVQGGCGEMAHPLKGNDAIYLSRGICIHPSGTWEERSAGFADNSDEILIYGQAARFAISMRNFLISLPVAVDVDKGDIVIYETTKGIFVLARPQRGQGDFPKDDPPSYCYQLHADNVRYATVVPGLLPLWAMSMRDHANQFVWPIDDTSGGTSGHSYALELISSNGQTTIAHAHCPTIRTCTMQMDGQDYSSTGLSNVSVGVLKSFVP
jgi:hypothetical protein